MPDAVDVVRIAAGERVHGGAVLRIDDEDRADRRFAVIGDERAGRHHADIVVARLVEMDAVVAVEFRPRRQDVFLVGCVDDEQHRCTQVGSEPGTILADCGSRFDPKSSGRGRPGTGPELADWLMAPPPKHGYA